MKPEESFSEETVQKILAIARENAVRYAWDKNSVPMKLKNIINLAADMNGLIYAQESLRRSFRADETKDLRPDPPCDEAIWSSKDPPQMLRGSSRSGKTVSPEYANEPVDNSDLEAKLPVITSCDDDYIVHPGRHP